MWRHTRPSWEWRLPDKAELAGHVQPAAVEGVTVAHGFSLLAQNVSRRFRRTRSGLSSLSSDAEAAASEPLLHGEHPEAHRHRHPRRHRSIFGLPLLLPNHWLCLVQLVVMGAVDATYTAFKVPITFALLRAPGDWSVSTVIDLCAGALFTADMLLSFHIAHPVKSPGSRHSVLPEGRAVAWRYVTRGSFAIDFLATLPAWIELGMDELHEHWRVPLGILNALRLLRLLRLGRFVKSVFVLSLGGQVGRKLKGWLPVSYLFLVNIVYAMLVLINLMGCTWLFVAELEAPEHSWLANVDGRDLTHASPLSKYICAIHFATTTMATVGYGDVSPDNDLERCVAMLTMIVGVIFFGFTVSALGGLLQHAGQTARRATLLHSKIQDVEAWMSARHLPRRLRKETVAFFCDAWIGQADVHEAELLAELPPHLKGKIVRHLLREVLANSQLFAQLDASAQAMLCAALLPRPLLPGHDLCHPGDPAECLWILQKGVVAAVTRTGENAEVLYAPAVLGEASLLTEQYAGSARRSCGFRAQEACMVWELGMGELQGLLFTHPRLKEQMLDGFHAALQARMQGNPRQRWKGAMDKLRSLLHPPDPGQAGDAPPATADAGFGSQPGSPGSSSSGGSGAGAKPRFQHSLDAMYHRETALALAAAVAARVRQQQQQQGQAQQGEGGWREQPAASPFESPELQGGRLPRQGSRVSFSFGGGSGNGNGASGAGTPPG